MGQRQRLHSHPPANLHTARRPPPELIEAASADDVGLGYQLTRDFAKAQTDLKLTASSRGTTLSAEYDTNEQLRSVGVSREVELGDQKMDVQPSWLLKARAARVKLMSSLNDGKDKVSAQVDFDVASKEARALELGLSRQLDTGRVVEAKYKPANSDLTISLTDSSFENGATWTATANVDASDAGSLLDTASVTLKRSWGW